MGWFFGHGFDSRLLHVITLDFLGFFIYVLHIMLYILKMGEKTGNLFLFSCLGLPI